MKDVKLNPSTIKDWFKENNAIESVVLGNTVAEIAENAFYECKSLQSINLTEKIISIGNNAFSGCTSLKNVGTVNIPTIGTWFKGLENLESITLGDDVTSIEANAFQRCSALENILLPASITSIGQWAFSGCNSLKYVYSQIKTPFATSAFDNSPTAVLIVPKGTKSDYRSVSGWKNFIVFEEGETIYDKQHTDEQGVCYTLYQDDNGYHYNVTGHTDDLLAEITIPNTITGCKIERVDYNAFCDCTNLKKVTFSDGLAEILFNAFEGCIALKEYVSLIKDPSKTSVYVPEEIYKRAHLIVPVGTKTYYLKKSDWSYFFIFEEGETVVNYDRSVTDEQGVKYELRQDETSFYYEITGHTDDLKSEIVIPANINGVAVRELNGYNTFKNCESLTKVTFPNDMTSIYFNAFEGCLNLTTFVSQIQDPSTVRGSLPTEVYERAILWVPAGTRNAYRKTYMGNFFIYEEGEASVAYERNQTDEQGVSYKLEQDDEGFKYSVTGHTDALAERVTIPETVSGVPVKKIEGSAFENCTGLKWISIPEGVTNIGNGYPKSVFTGCSLTLVLNQKNVADWSSCDFITALELGNNVDSIAPSAFSSCKNMAEITFGENVRVISDKAFSDCTSLQEVVLPKKIEMKDVWSSYRGPFYACSSINKVTIECERFGNWFSESGTLKTVYIGSGVKEVTSSALSGCSGLETITVDAANTIYDSRDNCNALIETATNNLLAGFNTTKIPESITAIAEKAFSGMSALTEVTIPAGVTAIGNYAFSGCTGLQSVTSYIMEPFSIGWNTFDSSTLSSATLRVPYLKSNDYKKTTGWNFTTIVEMEGSPEEMAVIEFVDPIAKAVCVNNWDHNGDGEISMGEAKLVNEITGFSYKKELVSFDEIKYFVNVTSIGSSAFYGCSSLASISIPEGVTSIGNSAFYGCSSLASISIPEGVTCINNSTFDGCKKLSSVSLPTGLTTISPYAFSSCSTLTTIDLPEGVTTIGEKAFSGTGIVKFTIPSTVTSIGNYALTADVIYCKLTTPISIGHIISNPEDVILYVPKGSEEAFKNADGWKEFIILSEGDGDMVDWTTGQVVVDVDEPGQLRLSVIELDDEEILRLKIRGSLNSEDIKYLVDSKSQGKLANLESLDLSEVTLIYGGEPYASKSIVHDDVWPIQTDKTLYYLSEKEEVILPGGHVPGIGNYTLTTYYYSPHLAGMFIGGGYKHIVMPKSVTKAAGSTFEDCKMLECVDFPCGITGIESYAFSGCLNLQSMNIEGVDSIGSYAFRGCKTLKTLEKISNVKYIGASAFQDCKSLMGMGGTLELTALDTIPQYAFSGCKMITNVSLSNELKYIGERAFADCKMLESVSLPNSLTNLSAMAFAGCGSLQDVKYSEHLMQVEYSAFNDTPWQNGLVAENGVKYMGHIALCYENESGASTATLSFKEGTTYISEYFINSIDYSHKEKIAGIILPTSLIKVGASAFTSLPISSVTLPDNLQIIGERAFYGLSNLTKLTLPENLKQIGNEAFARCTNLTIINYNAIKAVGSELFNDCSALEKVNVGAKVQLLPDGVFANCNNLTIVKFADREESTPLAIGNNSFESCTNLTSIKLPSTTESIGDGAFMQCTGLTSFTVPEKVTVVSGNMLNGCSKLTSITLHEGITTIGDEAFLYCSQIPSFTLPESLDSIGRNAFGSCYALTELTIPAGVNRLGSNFVESCYQLTRLVSKIHEPMELEGIIPMSSTVLAEVFGMWTNQQPDIYYDEVTLIVPDGCKPRYKRTAGWNKFKNIVEESGGDFSATNKLYVGGNTVANGGTTQLTVSLSNEATDLTAYQFDLIVPLGFKITTDTNGKYEVVKGNRYEGASHSLSVEKLPDHQYATVNKYRIVCVSANNALITGTDGVLLTINLYASEAYAVDDYEATLDNIIASKTDGSKWEMDYVPFNISVTQAPTVSGGDVNGDKSVDVSDAVSTINIVLQDPTDPEIIAQYDVNGDGEVDVFDVTKIISIILSHKGGYATPRRTMNMATENVSLSANGNSIWMGVEQAERFTAFQFDVEVPDGTELADVSLVNANSSHQLQFAKMDENRYKVIGLSLDNELLSASADRVIELNLAGKVNGDVRFSNIMFVDSKAEKTFFIDNILTYDTTGIYGVNMNQKLDGIYDLSGRKLNIESNQLGRGIYIINGKKVVIK